MRKLLAVILTGVAIVTTAIGAGRGVSAQGAVQSDTTRVTGLPPNTPVTVPDLGAFGNLIVDANGVVNLNKISRIKTYVVVLQTSCPGGQRIQVMEQSQESAPVCRDDQKQPPAPGQPCEPSRCIDGWAFGGNYTAGAPPQAAAGSGGGSHAKRNVGIGVLLGTLTFGAVKLADGNDNTTANASGTNTSSTGQTPNPPTNFSLSVNINLIATQGSIRGCNLILPNYNATGQLTIGADGRIIIVMTDASGIAQTFNGSGVFASGGTSFTFGALAPFPWQSSSGRSYSSVARNGSFSSTGSGNFLLDITYSGGGAQPGPPTGCNDQNNVAVTRQ